MSETTTPAPTPAPVITRNCPVGIDLGTTNSCVGIWQNGQVHIITNDLGSNTTPSVVYYDNDRRITVGTLARQRLSRHPKKTLYGVKRMIGQKFHSEWTQEFHYQIIADSDQNPLISLPNGQLLRPEEVSAQVLIKMRQIAENYLGQEVTEAVITVPAYFDDGQRAATKVAAEIAGLKLLRMINEPTAACLCYGLDHLEGSSHILVFDAGGGTTDVSLLSINDGLFEVLATNGDCHLGGEDFDLLLLDHFIQKYQLDHLTVNQRSQLKIACEEIKKQLSQTNEAEYELSNIRRGGNEEGEEEGEDDWVIRMSLAEWEQICRPLIDRAIHLVDQVLTDADVDATDIGQVVLVGGSTRIQAIPRCLSQRFPGVTINRSINPDEAVAYGAAIQAAILSQNDSSGLTDQIVLVDVTPLSLGLETTGGMMSVVVPRNTSIPCEKVAYYTTIESNQTEVQIKTFQGERTLTADCRL